MKFKEVNLRTKVIASAIAFLALAGSLMAATSLIEFKSIFGQATFANPATDFNHSNGSADVTIAAAGAGLKNCLTELDAIATGAYTVRVLDAGTTVYAVSLLANQGLVRDWSAETAPCSTANTRLEIKITTTAAGTYQGNYLGYVR